MNALVYLMKSLFGQPLPPDTTVNSPEFARMQRANEAIIASSNTIAAEILRMEAALRAGKRRT